MVNFLSSCFLHFLEFLFKGCEVFGCILSISFIIEKHSVVQPHWWVFPEIRDGTKITKELKGLKWTFFSLSFKNFIHSHTILHFPFPFRIVTFWSNLLTLSYLPLISSSCSLAWKVKFWFLFWDTPAKLASHADALEQKQYVVPKFLELYITENLFYKFHTTSTSTSLS